MKLVVFVLILISSVFAQGSTNSSLPCCEECDPNYSVNIVPIIKYKVFPIHIPYPILKPVPSARKCPEGFKRAGERKCFRTIKMKGRCPHGFFRVSDDTCIRVVIIHDVPDYQVQCPPGFKPKGMACVSGDVEVPSYKLPTFKTPKLPRIPDPELTPIKCPKGYVKRGKWRCVKVLKCPPGFKYSNTRCVKVQTKCPKGYKRIGESCVKDFIKCPRGYKEKGKKCVPSVVKHKCPEGYRKVAPHVCIPEKCVHVKCPKVLDCPKGQQLVKEKGECCYKCKPCKCPDIYKPVCGADGITYQNECHANCLKVRIKKNSACPSLCPEPTDRCKRVRCLQKTCPEGWKTEIKPGRCCPSCIPDTHCPLTYKPVCAEKNGIAVTFQNECVAKQVGAKVKSEGACKSCPAP